MPAKASARRSARAAFASRQAGGGLTRVEERDVAELALGVLRDRRLGLGVRHMGVLAAVQLGDAREARVHEVLDAVRLRAPLFSTGAGPEQVRGKSEPHLARVDESLALCDLDHLPTPHPRVRWHGRKHAVHAPERLAQLAWVVEVALDELEAPDARRLLVLSEEGLRSRARRVAREGADGKARLGEQGRNCTTALVASCSDDGDDLDGHGVRVP